MTCTHCVHADALFDIKTARKELRRYQKKGPNRPTAFILETLGKEGVEGMTLLDIGGGVGAMQHELVARGVTRVADADASSGYLETARNEAAARGYADRASYHHGDFLDLAEDLEPADIVTLDRVVCCYPDMRALVTRSAGKARRYYGLVYPRGSWLHRLGIRITNLAIRFLYRSGFRTYAHPPSDIDQRLRDAGLERIARGHTLVWEAVVYRRT